MTILKSSVRVAKKRLTKFLSIVVTLDTLTKTLDIFVIDNSYNEAKTLKKFTGDIEEIIEAFNYAEKYISALGVFENEKSRALFGEL